MTATVSTASYIVWLSGIGVEVCLLCRLFRRQLWRQHSGLFVYVAYNLIVIDIASMAIWRFIPSLDRSFYWKSETLSMALRFLVIWDIFRNAFPKGSTLKKIASEGVAVLAPGLVIICVCTFWSFEAYTKFHSVYPALERSFGFAQAVLVMGFLLMARYYALSLGRTLWGITVGFGAYVSISTANFALLDLRHSFLPYWQVVSPLSFLAMLGMWTWSVWVYAPNPPIAADDAAERHAGLSWWLESWDWAISTVRKVLHS